jgi:2,3-dimethylmalate lyase
MVEGGRTPILSAERLQALGYALAIYPAIGFLSATAALERVYAYLHKRGDSCDLPEFESYGFERMCELMGFPEVWAFERTWAERSDQFEENNLESLEPMSVSGKTKHQR